MMQRQHSRTSNAPMLGGVLQRKCACGGTPGPTGECAACKKKREASQGMIQRSASNASQVNEVPGIVHDVLRSPGQALETGTRAFMESRFGEDFSGVRVHTDSRAAESARAVNALAYTVGRNVVFDSGRYAPQTQEGQKLMAHELTHVIQQGQKPAGSNIVFENGLEDEADHTARTLPTRSSASKVQADTAFGLQRQQTNAPATTVPAAPASPIPATPQQQSLIESARRAAAIRTQIALFRTRGIVPPGPRDESSAATDTNARARRLAQAMFDWDNPNMEQISNLISRIVTRLDASTSVMVAAANDPDCGTRNAYVRGFQPPIVLCSNFFSTSSEQRIRTMIHEAAHLIGIGRSAPNESYCIEFDCVTSCGGFQAADSWAHFVHCLSDQIPDQPPTLH
jgi:Domain of unknown function (DUF4157)